jgi:uncharacterized protein YraI
MNKVFQRKSVFAFILLTAASLACSSQVSVYETPIPPNVETVVAATVSAYTQNAPQATSTKQPAATSVPASPTAEEFREIYVYTNVDNVNLRVNPGTLFQVSRVLPKNTRLRLLGQAPGGEWLNVRSDEGIVGWVNLNVVLIAYDGPPPPVVEPTDVILIIGSVETELSTPVSGIGFAIMQGSRRTDAMTDETGRFYAYLPTNMSGVWTVGYVSISCKSNTMDAGCNCINNKCGAADPVSLFVELPQEKDLKFIWK